MPTCRNKCRSWGRAATRHAALTIGRGPGPWLSGETDRRDARYLLRGVSHASARSVDSSGVTMSLASGVVNRLDVYWNDLATSQVIRYHHSRDVVTKLAIITPARENCDPQF